MLSNFFMVMILLFFKLVYSYVATYKYRVN